MSPALGARWFRHRGGMPIDLSPTTGRYLSFHEREEIAILKVQGAGIREIGRQLGRTPSTISRELRRNAATRGGKLEYRASVAQWKAELVAQRPKAAKLVTNEPLRDYVQERLASRVHRPDGTPIEGPATAPWKGRGKPHRKDRRWVRAWSPEQIANRLKVDFPNDVSMRISHEAIYQSLYVQSRGALKRELVACLRTGRALRVPRSRARRQAWAHVTPEVMISERPAEADDRVVPGHWEGDLLIGLERSAIGTLVDRPSRFTMLIHLPREEGYRHKHTPKNGPALAGYGAITKKDALASRITTLPEQLRRSLTWDRGKEMSAHAQFTIESGLCVYFADPRSPWQRGTNENTNGLLVSTSRRAPTYLDGAPKRSKPSLMLSMRGRERRSVGRRQQRHSMSTYDLNKKPVLLPLIEPSQFTSWVFTRRALDSGLVPSMGSIGGCYDCKAVIESFWSRLQVELLDRQRWRTRIELANEPCSSISRCSTTIVGGTVRLGCRPQPSSSTITSSTH